MIVFTDMEVAGFIPTFLNEDDPRSTAEQINTAYSHGGGWQSFKGFELVRDDEGKYVLQYPGDPLTHEVSRSKLHDETLILFEHSWFAIIQVDGSFDVSRLG